MILQLKHTVTDRINLSALLPSGAPQTITNIRMGQPNLEIKASQQTHLLTAIFNHCHGTSSTTDDSSEPISLSQSVSTQNIVNSYENRLISWASARQNYH